MIPKIKVYYIRIHVNTVNMEHAIYLTAKQYISLKYVNPLYYTYKKKLYLFQKVVCRQQCPCSL